MLEIIIIVLIFYLSLEEIFNSKKAHDYFERIKYYRKIKKLQITKKSNIFGNKKLLLAPVTLVTLVIILNSAEKTIEKLLIETILLAIPISYLVVYSYDKKRNIELVNNLPNTIEILCSNVRYSNNLIKSIAISTDKCKGKLLNILEKIYNDLSLGKSVNKTLTKHDDGQNIELTIFFIILTTYMKNSEKSIKALYEYADYLKEEKIYKDKINSLLAESNLYYIIICCLPICVFIMRFILEKEKIIQLYSDPMGAFILKATLTANIIAIFIVNIAMRGLK